MEGRKQLKEWGDDILAIIRQIKLAYFRLRIYFPVDCLLMEPAYHIWHTVATMGVAFPKEFDPLLWLIKGISGATAAGNPSVAYKHSIESMHQQEEFEKKIEDWRLAIVEEVQKMEKRINSFLTGNLTVLEINTVLPLPPSTLTTLSPVQ